MGVPGPVGEVELIGVGAVGESVLPHAAARVKRMATVLKLEILFIRRSMQFGDPRDAVPAALSRRRSSGLVNGDHASSTPRQCTETV